MPATTAGRGAPHLGALDGLRALGALMVLTTHVAYRSGDAVDGPLAGLLARLDAGVALFFVVSGFLLHRPHARRRLGVTAAREARRTADVARYARHRVARILPAAWLAVAAAALLLPRAGIGASDYLRVATMTQVYVPGPYVPGLTQLWSLSTEVAFYALLPLLAAALARLGGASWPRTALRVLVLTPVLAAAWTVATHDRLHGLPNLWLPAYAGWFGIGMALAVWREARLAGALPHTPLDDVAAAPGTAWAAAGALYLLLSTRVAGPYGLTPATTLEAVTKTAGYTLVAALVVLPCVAPAGAGWAVGALASRPARLLGDLSYGVFCYHLVVLGVVARLLGQEPFTGRGMLLWALTVAATLPVAWLSHRFVEEPVRRLARALDRS